MTPALWQFAGAVVFWIAIHLGLAGSPLRRVVVARIGEGPYRGLFALLSAAGLVWLILSYGRARQPDSFFGLWVAPEWLTWAPLLVMPFALLLLIGALTAPNPTAVGGAHLLRHEPRGVFRITRHPMLWAFALWALVHLLVNGDVASMGLFGSILVVALAGMASIDAKRAAQDPAAWEGYARQTSILPFKAVALGRTRLALGEIGWWRPLLALVAWAVLLVLHPVLFGGSPLPG